MPRTTLAIVLRRGTLAIWLVGVGACGGSAGSSPASPSTNVPGSPASPAAHGVIITWGFTHIYSMYSGLGSLPAYDNLTLMRNFVTRLAEGRAASGQIRVLYTTKSNLRDDPNPQNQAWYQPFLAMISQIGTVEFRRASQAPPGSFDVVIADFCAVPEDAERAILTTHVLAGGRVLVLGDNFCWSSQVNRTSAESANLMLRDLGIVFTTEEITERNPLAIAPAEQQDVLAGVSLLNVFRVTPQSASGSWTPIVTSGGKVLAAITTIPSAGTVLR